MLLDLMKKQVQEYKIKLPLTKKTIRMRSLLVKEEKLITQIQELSSTTEEKLEGLCKIVDSCCVNVNSKNLPIYDFQFLLTELRKRSYSDTSSFNITCPKTKEKVQINLNLASGVINKTSKEKLILKLPTAIFEFRRPTIDDLLQIKNIPEKNEEFLFLMINCLNQVENESEKIDLTLISKEEKISCLEYLNKKDYEKIKEFILESFVEYKIKYKTSDGVDRIIEVKDFANHLKFYLVTLI
tara:strand:+ start:2731 stop:3453 length:723 start_codon:yes stop_codon:yes gene_type:complete